MNLDTLAPQLSFFDEPQDDHKQKTGLEVRPIDYHLAKWTVLEWHYSHRMPSGKLHAYGVWESADNYVGAILFGSGATPQIGSPYGLEQSQVRELVRVAMCDHEVPVTQAVAMAIKDLKVCESQLRLLVSYADERQGHLGKIYQAGNWIYAGTSVKYAVVVNGEEIHPRTIITRYPTGSIKWLKENVDPDAHNIHLPPKHRYLYPLDKAMRRQINKLAQPHPRGLSVDGNTPSYPDGNGGSTPPNRS